MILLRTKYAAELNILDLDRKYEYRFIKKYRYSGEDREKVTTFKAPFRLDLLSRNDGHAAITVWYKRSYYSESAVVPINAEIAIFGPGE